MRPDTEGAQTNYVTMIFDRLVHPDGGEILPLSVLRIGKLSRVNWNTQASGILIEEDAAIELEQLWAQHFGSSAEIDDEVSFLEGAQRLRLVVHRHRERALREAKIAEVLKTQTGQLRCEVPGCGFDFYAVYGEIGRSYAHVHHLEPFAKRAGSFRTSLNQLAVVCANCHAMIHRGGECRDLRHLIKRVQKHSRKSLREY
jgi:predicted HNH restriction endonuclease